MIDFTVPAKFPDIMAKYSKTKAEEAQFRLDGDKKSAELCHALVLKLENEIYHWSCLDHSGNYESFTRNL